MSSTPEQGALPDTAAVERRIRSRRAAVMRTVIHLYFDFMKLILRARWFCRGGEHVEDLRTPFILASNHTGHADTHCILRVLPPDVAKRTAWQPTTTSNDQAGLHQAILISSPPGWNAFDSTDATSPSIGEDLGRLLRNWCLLMYPEGTRAEADAWRILPASP